MDVLQSRLLLRPRDFERSLGFYDEAIGLARYREWGEEPHRGVVYFLGGGYLELTESGSGQRPAGVRLWLQVADVAAEHEALAARGVSIAETPERKPWGLIEMVIHDPDGLPLVIVETPLDHPLRKRQ